MGYNGPKIESSLGLGDVRTGRRGVSSGSNTPTPFRSLVFASRGHHKLQSGRKEDPQALPSRTLRLPKLPRAAAPLVFSL